MHKKRTLRLLAFVLAAATTLGLLSAPAFATDENGNALSMYDNQSVSGSSVIGCAEDPAAIPVESVFVITTADKEEGAEYTSTSPYSSSVTGARAIDDSAMFDSYLCYNTDSTATGLLFIQSGAAPSGAVVTALIGNLTARGYGEAAEPSPSEPPEEEEPEALTLNISVKAEASADSIKTAAVKALKEKYTDLGLEAIMWGNATFADNDTLDITAIGSNNAVHALTVEVTVVQPTGVAMKNTIPAILATDDKNKTNSSLLAYVNSDLAVIATGNSDYEAALGETPTLKKAASFKWTDCDKTYSALGGQTYVFTQTYSAATGSYTLIRRVTVNAVTQSARVSINYDNNTVTTSSSTKWGMSSNGPWNGCSENMAIKSSWYDKVVYFYTPASSYASESSVTSVYIPPMSDKPTAKLQLVSTTHSITMTNCWDFGAVEYRFGDKGEWFTVGKESYTIDNLASNTSYSIYVRTIAVTDDQLASEAVKYSIKTAAPIKTSVSVSSEAVNGVGTIEVMATVAGDLSSSALSGKLQSADLSAMNNTLSTLLKKNSTVNTTIVVDLFEEEYEPTVIRTVSFTLPMAQMKNVLDNGEVTLELRTSLGNIFIDSNALHSALKEGSTRTLALSIQKNNSVSNTSSWKWLYTAFKNGNADVYSISANVGSGKYVKCQCSMPYMLDKSQTLAGVKCYTVSGTGAATDLDYEYDYKLARVQFDMAADGKMAIVYEGLEDVELPFMDVADAYWGKANITYCYSRGLFNGTSATTFEPELAIDRAMIVTLMSRLDGYIPTGKGTSAFSDVNGSEWYAEYAAWAKAEGLVTTSKFNATESMTRQDIAAMLYKFLQKNNIKSRLDASLIPTYDDDKDIKSANKTAVYELRSLGVMQGKGNNIFDANASVTRAEMATILVNVLKLL